MWGGLLVTAIVLTVHVVAASITMLTIGSNGTPLDYERHYEAVRTLSQDMAAIEKGASDEASKLKTWKLHYRGLMEDKGFVARDIHWIVLQLPRLFITSIGCLSMLVSIGASASCAWTIRAPKK